MSDTVRVSLGGVPLGTFAFSWSLTSGVNPETRVVEMSRARVAQVMELGLGPHDLVLHKPGEQAKTFKEIYVIGEQPGDSPHTRGVLLSDVRWLWPRVHVSRSYNRRRRTGKRRALGSRPEAADLVDQVAYAPWSLRDGVTKWTARRVLEDVLTEVTGRYDRWGIADRTDRGNFIENLDIEDAGHIAVLKVLQYLPGFDVYVNHDGDAIVYDTRKPPAGLAGRAHVDTGDVVLVDKSRLRPSRVDVFFVPEVEIRFDYAEDSQFAQVTTGREEPKLENVAPLPEWELDVDGVRSAQGEWHKIGDAAVTSNSATGGLLQAFEDNTPANATARSSLGMSVGRNRPLSLSVIRDYYFPGMRSLLTAYGHLAQGQYDAVWTARVQTILQHYRTTFRMTARWLDRVRSWRPYRVGIIDPATGGRAPSQVWTDYTIIPTVKGLIHFEADNESQAELVTGYSADLATGKAAPFRVDQVDPDQGIMRVEPRADPWGHAQSVVPGHPNKTVSLDLRRINNAALADSIAATWGKAGLAASWQMSTVLTVVPAGPNGLQRLYKRSVTPGELGIPGNCNGPVAQVFVGPGRVTAMFGWSDTDAAAIKEVFWADHVQGEGKSRWDNVEKLLVNEDVVVASARAAASVVYELYQDRYEGSYRGPLDLEAVPGGSMKTVTHQVAFQNGQTVAGTLFQLPPVSQALDAEAFLPDSFKQVVYRTAQP